MSSSLLLMEPTGGPFGMFLPVGRGCPSCGHWRLDLPGSSFLTGSSRHRRAWAHEVLRRVLLGQLLLSQDILTPVLAEALSLLLGPSNVDVEEALMLKPGCVTQRFLLSIFCLLEESFQLPFACQLSSFDG
ncbi:hypothetical protein CK203_074939 [Vitis vinifera]|uniref:Uncharacterized protein n=1 Tax=Vitis vinifera TaxID=29760 RepID=A0A438E8J3_VITVI|nr:hypothetical protein CK203_074939 [Vitis vinifera]